MKYKVIKSAAHNFGHSFVSLMNYGADDYVMSHLIRAALATGERELRVDLLSGMAEPATLLTPPVRASLEAYVAWLPQLLASHRVTPGAIRAGTMRLLLKIERASDDIGFQGHVELPFECEVRLVDDRGRTHVGRTHGFWSADKQDPPPSHGNRASDATRTRATPRLRLARPWWKFWARAA